MSMAQTAEAICAMTAMKISAFRDAKHLPNANSVTWKKSSAAKIRWKG